MAPTFFRKSGSGLCSHRRTRCGRISSSARIRRISALLTTKRVARRNASRRESSVHTSRNGRLHSAGRSHASLTTSSRTNIGIVGGRPVRMSSLSVRSFGRASNRVRHFRTVFFVHWHARAIAALLEPRAASRTIRARWTRPLLARRERTIASSSRRSRACNFRRPRRGPGTSWRRTVPDLVNSNPSRTSGPRY
jgi:hypothetical protein